MQISKFQFSEKEIRVITKDGDLWFVAKDICEILEIQNTTDALSRLDDDERSRFNLGRQGETNIINESGLYSLVLGSKKPEAKTFKKWVTSEVLPAIRKTGQYSKNLSTFELIAQMAQASAELEKKIAVHDQKISQLENKVEKKFTQEFEEQFITPTQLGAMFEPALSGKKINQLLRENNLQYTVQGQWVPTTKGKKFSSIDYLQLDNGKMVPQLLWKRIVKDQMLRFE